MLDLEPLLIARLESSVPELRGVHGAVSLGADAAAGKKLPAAFVVPNGHRIVETAARGRRARVASRWLVVVAVQNVRNIRAGTDARLDADRIVRACMRALMGWPPRENLNPLVPVDTPDSLYDHGVLLYPLAFECIEIIDGE